MLEHWEASTVTLYDTNEAALENAENELELNF